MNYNPEEKELEELELPTEWLFKKINFSREPKPVEYYEIPRKRLAGRSEEYILRLINEAKNSITYYINEIIENNFKYSKNPEEQIEKDINKIREHLCSSGRLPNKYYPNLEKDSWKDYETEKTRKTVEEDKRIDEEIRAEYPKIYQEISPKLFEQWVKEGKLDKYGYVYGQTWISPED